MNTKVLAVVIAAVLIVGAGGIYCWKAISFRVLLIDLAANLEKCISAERGMFRTKEGLFSI